MENSENSKNTIQPANKEKSIITTRPITLEDLEDIPGILLAWVKDSETKEVLMEELVENLESIWDSIEAQNNRRYFVALDNYRRVVGIMGMKTPDEKMMLFSQGKNPVEVISAHVLFPKRGVGSALLEQIQNEAKSKGHDELLVNSGPRYEETGWGFYDKSGFTRIATAKDYYDKGVDVQVWSKILSD